MRNYIHPVDLRRMRAENVTASLMQEIRPLLNNSDKHDLERDIHDAIYRLLWRSGVDVITDYERKMAGLPDRNNEGYTDDELRALEARRLEVMLKPIDYKFNELAKFKE